MKNRHLRTLILFGTFVLTGLFVVQLYWFKRAFDAGEKQFDHRIQVALMRVADSVSASGEVRKLSSNFFFVEAETLVDNESIDTLLRQEFDRRNIVLDYELGIYNAEDDTLVYGQHVGATRSARQEISAYTPNRKEVRNFAVLFPGKETYIVGQLDIWMLSTAVLLLMTCFFGWAIATLLRERRYAEVKTDFINNMTHEFRTPVTNIGITAEILRNKIPNREKLDVYLNILVKENEKLRNKIDKVLLGSSADQQKLPSRFAWGGKPAFEKIDIHKLISECAESFQLKVQERDGVLRLKLDAATQFVLGDRELLSQALNNVIDNAEKYSPARPVIVVRTADAGDTIEIDITDRGVGIPKSFHRKVFDKFYRVQHGNLHNVKGFGLGLSFVKQVIRSHRGKVGLFSDGEKGTQIRIILPIVP